MIPLDVWGKRLMNLYEVDMWYGVTCMDDIGVLCAAWEGIAASPTESKDYLAYMKEEVMAQG